MKLAFRWYGPDDAVTLEKIRQIPGVRAIVSACGDVPAGMLWREESVAAIRRRAQACGLDFAVAEGLPVHESIKLGGPDRNLYIEHYIANLHLLARQGVRVVCYNFMPVFGWIRTSLDEPLGDGSHTAAFHTAQLAAIDPLTRELALPGWNFSARKEELGQLLERYRALGERGLRHNLRFFLEAVVPEAQRCGIRLAIHPDDPPLPVFGLPRVVSTREDLEQIVRAVDSPANGITLCTGSLGCSRHNDVPRMAAHFAAMNRIPFVHARNVLWGEGADFVESAHRSASGSLDMTVILKALRDEGFDGYLRPDHGRRIWEEQGRPGYGLFDRALGAAYLTGLWEALGKCGCT